MDGCTDVYNDVCNYVGFSSTSKGKSSLSNENAMTDFCQTWYVGSGGGTSTTYMVCRHWMRIFNTSFAYVFWLANKKVKYLEFCIGYIDETWYVASDGHKYYTCGLLSLNAYLIPHLHICSDWLTTKKSNIKSSV